LPPCLADQVDDLWASIPVFLEDGAFLAIIRVADAFAAADHATTLVATVVALGGKEHSSNNRRMETNTDEKSTAISLRPLRFARASYLLPTRGQVVVRG
jgi:hypothetical protein